MTDNFSFAPGLSAEIAYRHERIVEAAGGIRWVQRGRARRAARAVAVRNATGRIGAARPAH
ncbi:MAG: hypothetical protein M3492_07450 [Actinomycetota bacterium]|nr:hypothetical protein [Actinomycetota bacterium]